MGFQDEIDKDKQGGDFYTMREGEQKFRIMSEPVKKVERFNHGICYPGAPYCDYALMDAEYAQKVEDAKKEGKDPSKVNKPSLSTKWMVWAILRNPKKEGKDRFVILQIPKKLAEKLRMWMDSDEYGFKGFPMPYDITIVADENVGKPTVKYDMMAARQESPVTPEELLEFGKKTPMEQILLRLQEKAREAAGGVQRAPHTYEGDEEISSEDVPF